MRFHEYSYLYASTDVLVHANVCMYVYTLCIFVYLSSLICRMSVGVCILEAKVFMKIMLPFQLFMNYLMNTQKFMSCELYRLCKYMHLNVSGNLSWNISLCMYVCM